MTDELLSLPGTPQILIVDDVPVNLRLLVDILTRNGYQVRPATSGHLALKSVAFELPDLILLDINMPDMNGYQVCRQIKEDQRTAGIPVIFISALDQVDDIINGFGAGGVDYITKPFNEAELLARIKTHLTLSRLQKQLERQNLLLHTEIAERKQAEAALNESEEKYRAVFENTGSATVIIEDDSTISLANAEFSALAGFARHEVEGRLKLRDFFPEDRQRMDRYHELRRLAPNSAPRQYECTMKDREGGIKNLIMTISMIPGTPKSVASMVDITQRKRVEEQLKYLSLHDPLTGLYNRTYFDQEMSRLTLCRSTPLSLIICDVDGLKLVNDTLGHEAGDELLVAASKVIRDSFRQGDVASRIGGDEFAVLLTNQDANTVEGASRRIRDAIDNYNNARTGVPLCMSIGFADSSHSLSGLSYLFEEADKNMYNDKIRNRASAHHEIIQAFIKMMEARDFAVRGHLAHMEELILAFSTALNMPEAKSKRLRLFAYMHDIGKVGVKESILFKDEPLLYEEMLKIRQHCEIGYRIAMFVPNLVPVADFILKHHEWWDGGGYPLGLKGEDIPLECRMLAVVDAYDAMTSDRPYRKAMDHVDAANELRRAAGTQFDPALVERFIPVVEATKLRR